MYDALQMEKLNELASARGGNRVSIFLPTVTAGSDVRQNAIRWKNLLRQAEEELGGVMPRSEDARQMLKAGWDIEADEEFWQHQGEGLAAYFDETGLQTFRLPIEVEETVSIGEEFHVKPLLPMFFENGPFYVLSLSQNDVRLFSGHRFHAQEVKVPGLPKSMDDALWADQTENQHQFHTVSSGGGDRGSAIFHGTGDAAQDRHKDDLKRYFDLVDKAVVAYLSGQRAPLVVASVDYLQPIYREANGYANLLEEGISGSPDELTAADLGRSAWEVVSRFYKAAEEKEAERFGNQISAGKTSADLEQILLAAHEGRIDTLWLSAEEEIWGVVGDDGTVGAYRNERAAGDVDLVDIAATRTLAAGGQVYAVTPEEIPGGTAMAAILRY